MSHHCPNCLPPVDDNPAPDNAGLREAMATWMREHLFWGLEPARAPEAADALLALPEVAALLAERDNLAAQVAAARREIAEEVAHTKEHPATEISVLVPIEAGDEVTEAIFMAVADAAYDAQPKDREGWDVFTSATKRPEQVPVHLLRRALGDDN